MKPNIYPEIKKIAGHLDAVYRLAEKVADKIDCDGLEWASAQLISGCSERDGKLYKDGKRLDNGGGLIDGDYYCCQYQGYCEDSYYGRAYFKTSVPGQFVRVDFDM